MILTILAITALVAGARSLVRAGTAWNASHEDEHHSAEEGSLGETHLPKVHVSNGACHLFAFTTDFLRR